MSKLAGQVDNWHRPIDKALFRALSFLLAIGHAGLILWEPNQYAEAIGGFNVVIAPLLIWAICSGVIFGIGFVQRSPYWRLFFSPYLSLTILLYLTALYLFA
ncbi:cyd operon protein YbgE [Vibrio sp. SCSIO 43137]|uniref:cyd operon protein YbgE n=1 Tax=Vibrio sp. SCSIO 43137 TaxID=3021011 RepID=UPI0023079728|nr:cyd operon protein YbgE [Vibrio sp. SCSIO 43137]WCE30721.1 cyd operon protein YbgE [Vibrio sp. SCSIO 43137]